MRSYKAKIRVPEDRVKRSRIITPMINTEENKKRTKKLLSPQSSKIELIAYQRMQDDTLSQSRLRSPISTKQENRVAIYTPLKQKSKMSQIRVTSPKSPLINSGRQQMEQIQVPDEIKERIRTINYTNLMVTKGQPIGRIVTNAAKNGMFTRADIRGNSQSTIRGGRVYRNRINGALSPLPMKDMMRNPSVHMLKEDLLFMRADEL